MTMSVRVNGVRGVSTGRLVSYGGMRHGPVIRAEHDAGQRGRSLMVLRSSGHTASSYEYKQTNR